MIMVKIMIMTIMVNMMMMMMMMMMTITMMLMVIMVISHFIMPLLLNLQCTRTGEGVKIPPPFCWKDLS